MFLHPRFPSDDIYETLRHEVVGVRVPLPPKTPEKETENMDAGEPESPASGSSTTTPYTDADGNSISEFQSFLAVERISMIPWPAL